MRTISHFGFEFVSQLGIFKTQGIINLPQICSQIQGETISLNDKSHMADVRIAHGEFRRWLNSP